MSIEEAKSILAESLAKHNWFDSIFIDGQRLVILTNNMLEAINNAPDSQYGFQIILHFSDFYSATKEKFQAVKYSLNDISKFKSKIPYPKLKEMLFEIQDGDDCVTELKNHYPNEFNIMKALYKEHGFDNIFLCLKSK